MRTVGVLAGAALVAVGFAAAGEAAAETTIKWGHFSPVQAYTARIGYLPWIRKVEEVTEGRVKFQEFWGGALSRAPDKQYELLVNGMQDATAVIPSYTLQLFPEFDLFNMPYLVENAEEASVAGWRLHKEGLLSGLDKMHVIAIYTNGTAALHFNRRIESLADMKGLKLRVSGPGETQIVRLFEAVPVGMAIGQTADALTRGVVDGTYSGWSALRTFRILPVLKSHYAEPLGVLGFVIGISKRVFDRIPERDRTLIDSVSGEPYARRLGQMGDQENREVIAEAQAKPDIIFGPSPAERGQRADLFRNTLHKHWIETHANGQRVYDAYRRILAEVRAGK
jgi:TRAP-type C4-dicarboxylate transport system substrate-binding protein